MFESQSSLVTVIIAFYNDGAFLNETIKSVVWQEYTNWELLLIDDGSTDNSTSIAKKFAMENEGKIMFVEHQGHANRGVCVSRNLGVALAHGKYIAILDGDDVWLPTKLSVQVDLMLRHPEVSMLCEATEYWYDWQSQAKTNEIVQVGTTREGVFHPPDLLEELYPLGYGFAPTPSGILLKRDAIIQSGGFEEQFKGIYQLYEDQAFLTKIYLNESVFVSKMCNHRYRQRVGSVVHDVTKSGQYYVVRRYFLNWLEKYIESNGNTDKTVKKLLRRAQVPYREPIRHYVNEFTKRWRKRISRIFLPVRRAN